MGRGRIFLVGVNLPGDDFEDIAYGSNSTLLEADAVLFSPQIFPQSGHEEYNGLRLIDQADSVEAKQNEIHWRQEIGEAASTGKLVVVYLNSPWTCYCHSGRQTISGTGRNRATTRDVEPISSYGCLPDIAAVSKVGSEVSLTAHANFLRPYWKEFGEVSEYQAEVTGNFDQPLLTVKGTQRVVGAIKRIGKGCILFLPQIEVPREGFTESVNGELEWTEKALQFGKRLSHSIIELAKHLRLASQQTPTPAWMMEQRFEIEEQVRHRHEIVDFEKQIASLQQKKEAAEREEDVAGNLRRLIYEQGHPLEDAIIEALKLFGFQAESFADGKSEFDAVFSCAEGRCLGEAEGKDKTAINIDKMSQLERNIQEDFEREEIQTHAKGVLFGNAYRLLPPEERGEFFTDKCLTAAKRNGSALVRTIDLFAPAKYLRENRNSSEYATACRAAIFETVGGVVKFPDPPPSSVKA